MLDRLSRGAVAAALLVATCSDPTSLTTEPDDTGGTGGVSEPGPTCIDLCVRGVGDCGALPFDEAECRAQCQRSLDAEYAQDEACGIATEDVFLCASALECDEYIEWLGPRTPGGSFPCEPEVEVFAQLIDDGVCLAE